MSSSYSKNPILRTHPRHGELLLVDPLSARRQVGEAGRFGGDTLGW